MTKTSVFLLVITLAACCVSPLSAQTRFGLKGGYNMASMPLSDDYQAVLEFVEVSDFENKSLSAYHAGVVVEFGFGGNLGLGTGLQFSAKGGKRVFTGTVLNVPYTRTRNVMPMYLQVPLTLHFRSGGFYASAGPYVGFAVVGKTKTKIEYGGDSNEESEDLGFGDEEGKDFSQIDYGAAFELGYEFFGNLRLSASYQLGLANILPADAVEFASDHDGDWSAKNSVIGVSLTYLFGREE
jgi:hypothetical protein